MFRSSRMFVIVLMIMAFATAAYAFAASHAVPVGDAPVTGYSVTNVTYTYSTENPSMIVFVDFDIFPSASKAGVSLNTGGMPANCGALTAGGTHAHCAVNVSVMSADMMRIVASD